jgi:flagellar P-ring protein FlgI
VKVSTVALTHGSLSISIKEEGQNYLRTGKDGESGDVIRDEQTGDLLQESDNTEVDVEESDASLMVMEEGVTLDDLVKGLNAFGVGPSDLIAILQSLKASGALQAELEII